MYEQLINALKAVSGISFTEYAWATRPSSDYGVYQLDFEVGAVEGDNNKVQRCYEGSVDAFLHAPNKELIENIESALQSVCQGSWKLNSIQYEQDTRLIHYEWVFQLEVI